MNNSVSHMKAAGPEAQETVVVKRSQIHGTGLFAGRKITKGEIVIEWKNTVEISECQLKALPIDERAYIEIQDNKVFLVGAPERFVNHSCDSNTMPGNLCDIAIRDILPGEEITANYSSFTVPNGAFECRCGSPKCSGMPPSSKLKLIASDMS